VSVPFGVLCVSVCGLRPPRYVSTGPVVVRLAVMANEREREREETNFMAACYRTGYRRQVNYHFGISRNGNRRHAPVSSQLGKWGLRRTKIVISVCSSAPCVRLEFLVPASLCQAACSQAYHLCAERGASICNVPSWILVLQSTVSPPTLESAPLTPLALHFSFATR
jgi:ribosomal protein S14